MYYSQTNALAEQDAALQKLIWSVEKQKPNLTTSELAAAISCDDIARVERLRWHQPQP